MDKPFSSWKRTLLLSFSQFKPFSPDIESWEWVSRPLLRIHQNRKNSLLFVSVGRNLYCWDHCQSLQRGTYINELEYCLSVEGYYTDVTYQCLRAAGLTSLWLEFHQNHGNFQKNICKT